MSGTDEPKPGTSAASDEATTGPSGTQSGAGEATNEPQSMLDILKAHENQDLADILNAAENKGANLITPLEWCPHLDDHVTTGPPSKVNFSSPCAVCKNVGENWLCLRCHGIYCSRYVKEHMLKHGKEKEHQLSISFSDLSVWCHGCEDYVDNRVLYAYKDLLHQEKFGTPYPRKAEDIVVVLED